MSAPGSSLPSTVLRTAHALEVRTHDALRAVARRRGWLPSVRPSAGYAGPRGARVLGRVVLAPALADTAARHGLPGWRRFLTLELAAHPVSVSLQGASQEAVTDGSGFLDVVLPADLAPGTAVAELLLPGRPPGKAHVHVADPGARVGVVCDVDDTAWVTGLRHPLRAAWRTLAHASTGRTPVPGMAALLHRVVEGTPHAPVAYVSNGPWNLVGPVSRFLDQHGFPAGAVLMTDWGLSRDRWLRDGKAHKASCLRRLRTDFPGVRWVLVGDDGEHDPELYGDFAREHPDDVVAILLRQTSARPHEGPRDRVGPVPVLRGIDGRHLLSGLDELLRRM